MLGRGHSHASCLWNPHDLLSGACVGVQVTLPDLEGPYILSLAPTLDTETHELDQGQSTVDARSSDLQAQQPQEGVWTQQNAAVPQNQNMLRDSGGSYK